MAALLFRSLQSKEMTFNGSGTTKQNSIILTVMELQITARNLVPREQRDKCFRADWFWLKKQIADVPNDYKRFSISLKKLPKTFSICFFSGGADSQNPQNQFQNPQILRWRAVMPCQIGIYCLTLHTFVTTRRLFPVR